MLPVAGRPILERLIHHLVGYGITRIFLSVNHLAHLIEDHFGDGSDFGCRIEYLREETALGTGGPLRLLPDKPRDPILVMKSFYYYWSQKKQLHSQKSQAYQWRYQLMIQDNDKTTRWVYDPRGYAKEVTLNQSSPLYQVNTVRAFNRFLNSLSTSSMIKENNNE